eukprot:CAMPEP_0178463264 /NCGR_PEP_ID=MMETSP0689_2-20121128/50246_1 /TAXON_ID=160604 /ORGANISM="Amphidinium massartii, Strain CS-259" /LENGTH=425 /DNA_ID=CAMNT_0020090147 /DNA_START=32 /DNA_END=1306 /DNA_ORIENTATION=-
MAGCFAPPLAHDIEAPAHMLRSAADLLQTMLALSVADLAGLMSVNSEFCATVQRMLPNLGNGSQKTAEVSMISSSQPAARPSTLMQLAALRLQALSRASHRKVSASGTEFAFVSASGNLHLSTLEQQQQLAPLMRCIPTKHAVVSVASGAAHVLLLDVFGAVYSFGEGFDGQLGHGAFAAESAPRRIALLATCLAYQIAAGHGHSMVLATMPQTQVREGDSRNEMYAFGLNDVGQLGVGSRINIFVPTAVAMARSSLRTICCGEFHSACISRSGELFTWGSGRGGRLALGHEEDQLRPVRVRPPSEQSSFVDSDVMQQFLHVACGASCTITHLASPAGRSFLWAAGTGFDGELGDGRSGQGALSFSLTLVSLPLGLPPVVNLYGARALLAAVLQDGSVYAWGQTGVLCGGRKTVPTRSLSVQSVK